MDSQLNVIIRFELSGQEQFNELILIIKEMGAITTKAPCFISAKFHRNDDFSLLINYSTWESSETYHKFWDENVVGTPAYEKILNFKPQISKVFGISLS